MTRLAEEFAEENQSLLLLATSPMIWAAHFMLSYLTAAIWCAKMAGPDASLGGVRVAIAIYTVLALSGIGITGWRALRRHRYGTATLPHDDDLPEDRHRFLGFAALLLSALSVVAVIYAALVIVFIKSCS
jgi:hypothetical protein